MADKTMNLRPFHCEQEATAAGFVLVVFAATEGGKRVKVRLHFDFWWVRFLARELWKAIQRRQQEVSEAEKAMEARHD